MVAGTYDCYVPTAHTFGAVKWMHRVSATMWSQHNHTFMQPVIMLRRLNRRDSPYM